MKPTIYVLIVEDMADELEALMLSLQVSKETNYVVYSADNGVDALRIAEEMPHLDIALMDINLGEGQMNGIQTAAALRQIKPTAALSFVSAYPEQYYDKSQLLCQPENWLTKPFQFDDIHYHIDQTLKIKARQTTKEPMKTTTTIEAKLREASVIKTIDLKNILAIKAEGGKGEKVILFMADKTELIVNMSLKQFEEQYDYFTPFLRVHKSNIVNFDNPNLQLEYSKFRVYCDEDKKINMDIANGKMKKADLIAFINTPYDVLLKQKLSGYTD